MSTYRYVLRDNTVYADGFEQEMVVLDLGDWEREKLFYYRSLLAHKRDLEYAEAYLNQMFFDVNTSLIDGALINAAIQLLVKCFSSQSLKGRRGLSDKKVFHTYAKKLGEADYLQQFYQLSTARNKVLAHDELDHVNNIVGLVVDRTSGEAVDIAELTIRTGYLYAQNKDLLLKMVRLALSYVCNQIENVKTGITEEYNNLPSRPSLAELSCETVPMATAW